jgi:hypothetical protein
MPSAERARAEHAIRAAEEVGADEDLGAGLYLVLARKERAAAEARLAVGDTAAARRLFLRAEADAELSFTVAREASVRDAAVRTQEEAERLGEVPPRQGSGPARAERRDPGGLGAEPGLPGRSPHHQPER